MSIPLPYADQFECRNETLEVYGSDRRGEIEYRFNNYGYRNIIDYRDNANNVGIYSGSSLTAGIGVDWNQTFSKLSSDKLNVSCYQFSQGCVMIDNQETLRMLKLILKTNIVPKYIVLQFIGLDRRYDPSTGKCIISTDSSADLDIFLKTFNECEQLLENQNWCFLGADGSDAKLPDYITKHINCAAWNPSFIDIANIDVRHPGNKWHSMVSYGIIKSLQKQIT